MANCLAVWLLFVCCFFKYFFFICFFFPTATNLYSALKHGRNICADPAHFLQGRREMAQNCGTTDPIYFSILYDTVSSVGAEYSSSVTLTWNISSCMGLELLHVNGKPFYQICALF